jgi:hypothetical protein
MQGKRCKKFGYLYCLFFWKVPTEIHRRNQNNQPTKFRSILRIKNDPAYGPDDYPIACSGIFFKDLPVKVCLSQLHRRF